MRKIEHKIVKKYAKPRKPLFEMQCRINHAATDRQIEPTEPEPDINSMIAKRLAILYGPHARDYIAVNNSYTIPFHIRQYKSFSKFAMMYVSRERKIDKQLAEDRESFKRLFVDKFGIPFSVDILSNVEWLTSMGLNPRSK